MDRLVGAMSLRIHYVSATGLSSHGQCLEMNVIGIEDSFLLLGGDSLKMMRMLNRVKEKFGRKIAITDFFLQPTIAQLSDKLARP